jgi:alkylation response protein AidB-like acyl-CoA dehydrogenase
MLFNAVFQAMKVIGVNAMDKGHPLERYLREASVFPLYDAGNVGMQMQNRAVMRQLFNGSMPSTGIVRSKAS